MDRAEYRTHSPIYSLRTKLILIISLIIIGICSGLSWYFIHQQIQSMSHSLMNTGDILVKNLSHNSRYGLITGDTVLLEQLADGAMHVGEVVYVVMTHLDGKPIIEKTKGRIVDWTTLTRSPSDELYPHSVILPRGFEGKTIQPIVSAFRIAEEGHPHESQHIFNMENIRLPIFSEGEEIYDFVAPVWKTVSQNTMLDPFKLATQEVLEETAKQDEGSSMPYGIVRVGMSGSAVQGALRSTIWDVMGITIVIIGLGITSTVMLANRIILPLRRLVDVAGKVMEGDLSALIRPSTNDEVGQLTKAFNQMTQSLAEQQHRLASVLSHLPEGVLLVDSHNCLVLANTRGFEYLKYLGKGEMGKSILTLGEMPMTDILRSSQEKPYVEIKIQDPQPKVFEIAAASLKGGENIGKWIIVIREATADREIQQRLEQQERLAAVGRLAAGMAHDLNNILTGIVGSADLLARDFSHLSNDSKSSVNVIIDQSSQASQLVKQVLDFSRKSVSRRIPLNLTTLVHETSNIFQHTFPDNILIHKEVFEESYWVNADPTQMKQVLMNLAVNAQDSMKNGGKLTLSLSKLFLQSDVTPPCAGLTPGQWIVFSMSDTGSGILPNVIPRIFEPFFTTKEIGQGTGLGLAQVYGLIKAHEGEISVHSELEIGTTFKVYLPACYETVSSGSQKEQPTPMGLKQGMNALKDINPKFQENTILVVEDKPAVLDICQRMLQSLGWSTHGVLSAEEAIQVCHQHQGKFDMVLTDLTMAGMNGMDLYHQIKATYPMIKVAIMTGYPLVEEGKDLLEAGIDGLICKPIKMGELEQLIHATLGHTPNNGNSPGFKEEALRS